MDDRPTIPVDDASVPAVVLAARLESALVGEGWEQPEHDFRLGSYGAAFKHLERRLSLEIVDRPGRAVRADLACEAAHAPWSVLIIGPTVGQLRAAARAATAESPDTEADLVVSLRVAGWGVDLRPDRPRGCAWATRPDRRRYVAREAGKTSGRAGEWYVQGDGLDVSAGGATPYAVVAALASS
jgi:hypothetical protein